MSQKNLKMKISKTKNSETFEISSDGTCKKYKTKNIILHKDISLRESLIEGDTVIISGSFDGKIIANRLTISETGSVSGEIHAQKVENKGIIKGILRAHATVLAKNSTLEGYCIVDYLKTEFGSNINGDCHINIGNFMNRNLLDIARSSINNTIDFPFEIHDSEIKTDEEYQYEPNISLPHVPDTQSVTYHESPTPKFSRSPQPPELPPPCEDDIEPFLIKISA